MMKRVWIISWIASALAISSVSIAGERQPQNAPDGWTTESPRDEIRPHFSWEADGGPDGAGCFVLTATGKSENMGRWIRTFPVVSERHFSFRALRKANGIETPRRNTMVRITWLDAQGKEVFMAPGNYLSLNASSEQLPQPPATTGSKTESKAQPTAKWLRQARYEFPVDRGTTLDGWTEVSDVYLVPPNATQAKVELCLRWSRSGEVRWSYVSLTEVPPPKSRKVRLATVYLRMGKNKQPTVVDACRLFAEHIAEAAQQGADIVCLPEVLTAKGTGKNRMKSWN